MNEYRITPPQGKVVHIIAKTKAQAIKEYCSWTGIPERFVKEHCTVKNLGRIHD